MRKHFRYLNDILSVNVKLADGDVYPNDSVKYRVDIKATSKSDDFYTTIYRGSVFLSGPTTIYLNDIIEANMDDYGWFKNLSISATDMTADEIKRTYVDVRVVVELYGGDKYYYLTDILNGYLSPNMEHEPKFDVDDTPSIKAFSDYGYKVVPHIPYNTRSWEDDGMHVNFNLPVKLWRNTDVDSFRLQIKNENGGTLLDVGRNTLPYPVMGVNITDSLLKLSAPITKEGYVMKAVYDDEETTLAVIDYEPAEYYLMWINRYGTTQCQPFCRKNTLAEDVSTSYITTMNNESISSNKSVDFTWTLNSHWLTYDEHGEFESLLVSKYVWLYDVKKGWYYPVNVTDSKWSYKNPNNNKRPFNLTVNVKSSQAQNINY